MKKEIIHSEKLNSDRIDAFVYEHYTKTEPEIKKQIPPFVGPVIEGIDVGKDRYGDTHPTYPLIELAKGPFLEERIEFGGYTVRYFLPESVKEKGPAVFYFHGGGWKIGAGDKYNNCCRYIAERIQGPVVSVDYTLSPETKFPTAVEQCYAAIDRFMKEADKWHIAIENVSVLGDSAGSNLAAAVCIRDKETHYIKRQILYYPLIDFTSYSHEHFDISLYGPLCKLAQDKIKGMSDPAYLQTIRKVYLGDRTDYDNPLISPIWEKDLSIFPQTIMFTAEFDFLRMQSEDFAERLDKAGVEVNYYLCEGCFHGLFEKLGYFSASQKSIDIFTELIL